MEKIIKIEQNLVINDREVINYIRNEYEPDKVYKEDVLIEFARSAYYPEDIFPKEDLEIWAEKNGYVKVKQD